MEEFKKKGKIVKAKRVCMINIEPRTTEVLWNKSMVLVGGIGSQIPTWDSDLAVNAGCRMESLSSLPSLPFDN